jgi:hypothetical protein
MDPKSKRKENIRREGPDRSQRAKEPFVSFIGPVQPSIFSLESVTERTTAKRAKPKASLPKAVLTQLKYPFN